MTVVGTLPADDPLAVAMTAAIQDGDAAALRRLLEAPPDLANRAIANAAGVARTPVLIATDWPGHFPRVATTISILAAAGADVNVRLPPHPKDPACMETPLHQAASSNDVAAIDALLDAGADIDATGAIFTWQRGGRRLAPLQTLSRTSRNRRVLPVTAAISLPATRRAS